MLTLLPLFLLAADVDQALGKPKTDPLVGVYRFVGSDGKHEVYGTVSVFRQHDAYLVVWVAAKDEADDSTTSTSVSTVIGHGMREGNAFSVFWKAGNTPGLSVFTIDPKTKRLTGRWTAAGSGNAFAETWVWLCGHSKGA